MVVIISVAAGATERTLTGDFDAEDGDFAGEDASPGGEELQGG